MNISYFMDILFDLINESDALDVREMEADLQNHVLCVTSVDGSRFDVAIKKLPRMREPDVKQMEGEIIPLYR